MENDTLTCVECGEPIRRVVEPHDTYYESLTDGDSLSYVPTLHNHKPGERHMENSANNAWWIDTDTVRLFAYATVAAGWDGSYRVKDAEGGEVSSSRLLPTRDECERWMAESLAELGALFVCPWTILAENARTLGRERGEYAASWLTVESVTRARGILDGDPEHLDALPRPDLSGEWADDETPTTLARSLGIDPDEFDPDALSALCDEWQQAADDAVSQEADRLANAYLAHAENLNRYLGEDA